jgi:murein DD-endopeptidase MepM/ murein hydrolase activator NlpD
MCRNSLASLLALFVTLIGPLADAKTTCFEQTLCIEKKQEQNRIHFTAINLKKLMAISGKISLITTNMEVVDGDDGPFVLNGGESRQLFTLEGSEDGQWQYHQSQAWVRGDYRKQPEEGHIYGLPFKPGATFAVLQGCDSNYTHQAHDAKSIDFDMPAGTGVYAARGGLIVDMKEDSLIGGTSPALRSSSNKIIIEHGDGTMAQYGHLQHEGVMVELGDQVETGQLVGFSGNTGYSSQPHLHFGVTSATKTGTAKSLAIAFQTSHGTVVCPKVGRKITHP